MCRHMAVYVQLGADLEMVKRVRNGYERKLKVTGRQQRDERDDVM